MDDLVGAVGLALVEGWNREPNPYHLKDEEELVRLAVGIAKNIRADEIRHSRKEWIGLSEVILNHVESRDLYDSLPMECLSIEYRQLIQVLSPRQQQVVHLSILNGMSQAEAARQLGLTKATVATHWKRARDELRMAG